MKIVVFPMVFLHIPSSLVPRWLWSEEFALHKSSHVMIPADLYFLCEGEGMHINIGGYVDDPEQACATPSRRAIWCSVRSVRAVWVQPRNGNMQEMDVASWVEDASAQCNTSAIPTSSCFHLSFGHSTPKQLASSLLRFEFNVC